jgi:hypothetical protein
MTQEILLVIVCVPFISSLMSFWIGYSLGRRHGIRQATRDHLSRMWLLRH